MMNSAKKLTGPINLGNPSEYTMLELAECVLRLTNSKSKLLHLPLPEDDPKQRKPDISLAEENLNWTPRVCLEDGLRETVSYFEKMIK